MTRELNAVSSIGKQIRNFGPSVLPADAPDPELLDEAVEETVEEVQESPDPKALTLDADSATELAAQLQSLTNPETVPTVSETTAQSSADAETKEESGSLLSSLDPNLG